jgi:DnaJ-class molecular chaperone
MSVPTATRNVTVTDFVFTGEGDGLEQDCRDCNGLGYTDEYDPDHSFCVTCNGQGWLDPETLRYAHLIR